MVSGAKVGSDVGRPVGAYVGFRVGEWVGRRVGVLVGLCVDDFVLGDGLRVGAWVVGIRVGEWVGAFVGLLVARGGGGGGGATGARVATSMGCMPDPGRRIMAFHDVGPTVGEEVVGRRV